jgi:hypothetical protein
MQSRWPEARSPEWRAVRRQPVRRQPVSRPRAAGQERRLSSWAPASRGSRAPMLVRRSHQVTCWKRPGGREATSARSMISSPMVCTPTWAPCTSTTRGTPNVGATSRSFLSRRESDSNFRMGRDPIGAADTMEYPSADSSFLSAGVSGEESRRSRILASASSNAVRYSLRYTSHANDRSRFSKDCAEPGRRRRG